MLPGIPQDVYLNRQLSQLEFNHRVLKLAKDPTIPLLERLKFLFIFSNNMDEFFEVHVAALKQQITFPGKLNAELGSTIRETLTLISEKAHKIASKQYELFNDVLLPSLEEEKIRILEKRLWNTDQKNWVNTYFREEVLPIISPIALDVAHPFPQLVNKSLNFIVTLEGKDAFGRTSGLAVVHVPRSLPRIIPIPTELRKKGFEDFFSLGAIIEAHMPDLFPGMSVTGNYQFRVTRDSEVFLDEKNIEDLALAVKTGLLARRFSHAVRLEISYDCPEYLANFLLEKHELTDIDLYRQKGPVNLARFMALLPFLKRPDLRFEPFTPGLPKRLKQDGNLFDIIRDGDILLHHPYQSFEPVVEFIRQATLDPEVLAIKQTLYRVGAGSKMVRALIDAAKAGKEVTAVIELRARFDEASNIELASSLQEAGALVVYGIVGYKTHAKMTLIVRRENNDIEHYVHLSTGNYHGRTAREYTDIGLLTCNTTIGHDVQLLFQELTGMGEEAHMKLLLQSPFTLAKKMETLIHHEIEEAKKNKPAKIILKMNAITDTHLINLLYKASQAGVKIELIVRGMCCLRPGLKGISENIKVKSVLGRFLEHSRIFYFYHGGEELVFCSSADWMERNLYHRIELCFPILNKTLAHQVKEQALMNYLKDNTHSWILNSQGRYSRRKAKGPHQHNAQEFLLKKLVKS